MDNYKITILGPSGAGKTIFIACLYKMLSTYQDKYGFFLSVEDEDGKFLNNIFTQLGTGKTGESLSTGTTITKELKFEVCVKNRNLDNIPVCQLTYKDYRGGQVTDVNPNGEDNTLSLKQEIRNSDAVWVIIDGQKTLAFMENFDNQDVKRFWGQDLTGMMQLIEHANKKTTVNFLISKWDVIEKTYSLSEISNRLLEKVPDFSNVVSSRKGKDCSLCSLYLIPVSSLGIGFVTLQPDGTMQKKPGRIPKPLWVEVPLIFFLVDKLKSQVEELKPQINSKIDYYVGLVFAFLLGSIIFTLQSILWSSIWILIGFVYLIIRSDQRNKNTDKYNPMKNMLEKCENQKNEFLARFPHSLL
ncbi:MAG: hypothetical protein KA716_14880 [Gloeotrichia echinulata DEX184]|nr:hypothetical protein [Gloeotrichia echinulata DEX184]